VQSYFGCITMKNWISVAVSAALLTMASEAQAIVRGHGAGAIGRHVVRLVGRGGLSCSATVIGRQEVLTSSHCLDGSDPYFVIAGGRRIRVTSYGGYGSAARLVLASSLPGHYAAISMEDSSADTGTLTIAGYGTAVESSRARTGALRAATLVSAGADALVDAKRRGVSACMGDSGGPVARFDGRRYVLVGIIDRASNPSPTRACGYLTHYVSMGGFGSWFGAPTTAATAHQPGAVRLRAKRRRAAR
jgi:secreted trypsin-like serine protease